jgi:mannose-6-phosphate isomerase-like protein (cupin superfamily)
VGDVTFGRRVVTGHDDRGDAVFVSDGPPPHAIDIPGGAAVADVWSFERAPTDPADGFEPTGGFPIEPPPGGMWWRFIRLPLPDQTLPREEQFLHSGDDPLFSSARPGMHATNTLDLCVILDGNIELEAEEGCVRLGPGDCVVQRGTQHRWRVVGSGPCTYAVALFAVDPAAGDPAEDLRPQRRDGEGAAGPRRVVVGVNERGRSIIESDGPAPNSHRFANGMVHAELWQTGGRVAQPAQGGDAEPVSLTLDPIGMGISWKYIEFSPVTARTDVDADRLRAEMRELAPGMSTTGHHDPDDPGMHRTDTIDLDLILEGALELELPGGSSVQLQAGDVVVQRGTWHKWHNRSSGPTRMLAIMVGAPLGGAPADGAAPKNEGTTA